MAGDGAGGALPIEIRAQAWIGVVMLAAGALQLVAGFLGGGFGLFPGPLFAVLGIMQLNAKPVVVANGEVQLRNAFGMTLKRVAFSSPSQLSIEDNKLFCSATGERKKVTALSSFAVRSEDVERLRRYISGAGAADVFE